MKGLYVDKICARTQEGKCLLQELSFSLPRGTVFGIYGPNGSGKSTLLKALVGNHGNKKVSGDFWIDSLRITEMHEGRRFHEAIYLGSDFQSPFDLTVKDLFEMGLSACSEAWKPQLGREEEKKINAVIERLSLRVFLSRNFSTLSDGEKQMMMFARCLIQAPKVLILDETFSKLALDKLFWVGRVLKEHADRGATFLVSSHDLNFLSEICDQLLILNQGQCVAKGSVFEVMTQGVMAQLFPDISLEIIKSPANGKPKVLY